MTLSHYEVLITVSRGCPPVMGRLPTRYSPVRRFPLVESTEASSTSFSLDLHVLGTPPAFILSQDQTLKITYIGAVMVFLFVLGSLVNARQLFNNLLAFFRIIYEIIVV